MLRSLATKVKGSSHRFGARSLQTAGTADPTEDVSQVAYGTNTHSNHRSIIPIYDLSP